MASGELSKAEARYLGQLLARPPTVRSRLIGWAFELIPSIGLFAYGLHAARTAFVVLGFLSLLYFSVWRMYSQLHGARMLRRIIESGAGSIGAQDGTDPK